MSVQKKYNLENSIVAVTGACGFIGSHLINHLLHRNVKKVIAIDSLASGSLENLNTDDKRVEFIKFDLGTDDKRLLELHLQNVDFVFHLAAIKGNIGINDIELITRANVSGSEDLYDAAGSAGVKKIIFSSSLYAYGRRHLPAMKELDSAEPDTHYGISKLTGENILRLYSKKHGYDFNLLRYFFVYGPGLSDKHGYKSVIFKNFERLLKGQKPLIYGDGEQALDYIYIDDVCEATIRAVELDVSGELFNVGSGKATSVKDLTRAMNKIHDYRGETEFLPHDNTAGTYRESNIEKINQIMDWLPKTDLYQGLIKTYQWLKKSQQSVDVSVIAPCFNEQDNIIELTERLQNTFNKEGIFGEIILVDDCSTDNTKLVIEGLSQKYSNVTGVHHKKNKGLFAGWKSGIKVARGTYSCFIDSDLQNLPEDVARLYSEIVKSRYDVVQGFRSSVGRIKDSRLLLSKGLNFLLNTLFSMKAKDNKSGFVIARTENLKDCLRLKYNYYYPQSFIRVSAEARGLNVREIETIFESRKSGESFITKQPIKPTLLSFVDLAKAFFEFKLLFKKGSDLEAMVKESGDLPQEEMSFLRKMLFNIYIWSLPIHSWMLSNNIKKYYFELKASQHLSSEKIKELQEAKLRKLIYHAYNHVAYYRELFDKNNIRPQEIKSIEDLKKLPFLTKNDIRENIYFGLLSDNHDKKRIMKISTSGSTSEPLSIFVDKHQLEMRWAATLRSMEWTPYRFGDRNMRLWHQTIGMTKGKIIKERIDAFLMRRKFVPAFEMNNKTLEKFFDNLEKWKPVLIDGYAESFNMIARHLKETGRRISHSPKAIITSAQNLDTDTRKIIEESFKTKVYDKYGSREFSGIAYEAGRINEHYVVAENYIVEIMKDGRAARNGEVGEVLVTDLNNFCMPLIRYKIGDMAVAHTASNENDTFSLPKLGAIEGRVRSIIRGNNGHWLPGVYFSHFFKEFEGSVRQYRIIQERAGEVVIEIVKNVSFTREDQRKISAVIKKHLGEDMKINFMFVDNISLIKTGKRLDSISKQEIDFQKINIS